VILIGSGTLGVVDGKAVATFSTRTFHGGVNEITAEYIGESNFTGSRSVSPLLQKIIPAAVIRMGPPRLTFLGQLEKKSSDRLTVTLTNIGDAKLPIAIEIVGVHAKDFSQTNNCQSSLGYVAPANSCEILVAFKPGAVGVRSASLSVVNSEGSRELLALMGSSFH